MEGKVPRVSLPMQHKHEFKLVPSKGGFKAKCSCGLYLRKEAK